jgi:hypothetical protein
VFRDWVIGSLFGKYGKDGNGGVCLGNVLEMVGKHVKKYVD